MKKMRTVLYVFMVFCLMMSVALAGTTRVVTDGSTNSPYIIASEVLGISRTAAFNSAATGSAATVNAENVGVSYTLGQQLTNSNLLQISLTGVNFTANTIRVCASENSTGSGEGLVISSAVQVGQVSPTAGSTTVNVQISGANVSAGAVLFLSTNASCVTVPNMAVNVPAGLAAGRYPITMSTLTSGNIPVDTASSMNVVTVTPQYASYLNAGNLITIDYQQTSANGSLNGTHFTDGLNAASVNLLAVNNNASSINGTVSTFASGSTFSQSINLTDSAGWQGVAKVYTTNASSSSTNPCLLSTNTAINSAPTGTVTLTPAGTNAFNGTSTSTVNTTLCVQASGNLPLEARTITGTYGYAVTAGTGVLAPSGQTGVTYQTWAVNAYQAFNPYMYWDTAYTQDVFNRFYNSSTREANVIVDVYPADGSASQSISLGTLPQNEAGLYWASDIGILAGFSAGTSYAARFTVTAPPSLVNGVSFFKRASGSERPMPLYKSNTQAYLMQ